MLLQKLIDFKTAPDGGFNALVAGWEPVFDRLPGWFWSTDKNYRLTYVSENVGRTTGSRPDQLIGISILDPVYGDVKTEAGIDAYYAALKAQQPFDNLCYERNMKDGSRVVLMDSAIPVMDAAGAFRGYHGVSIHVSHTIERAGATSGLVYGLKTRADALERELSRRNAELEANNKLLSEVLEAMGEGLIVISGDEMTDPDNKVVMVNPAYRKLYKLSEDDVRHGTPVPVLIKSLVKRGLLASGREVLTHFQNEILKSQPVLVDIQGLKRTCNVTPSRRRNGGHILVLTDVTDLRERNKMLEQARDAAEVAANTKSSFLATMSHEIRTPMNGIVGMADMLAETSLDPEQTGFVETIRSSALALTGLISDILDFSKIEAGRMQLNEAAYDLRALLDELCGLVYPLARSTGLQLTRDVKDDVPVSVHGDAFRLRQVLLNLLGNAVKFTPEGLVSLTVSCAASEGMLVFEVKDTGIGIPADKLDQIFSPFEQVDAGYRRGYEGSGLGLAITRDLVKVMGGELSVSSEVNRGSTFHVLLPLKASGAEIARQPPRNDVMRRDFSGKRVLVAEDNRTNQLVVRRMLEKSGVQIVTANNGREACDLFEKEPFDMVLMDMSMPVMSGLDASIEIRRLEKSAADTTRACPIVALTGNAFDRDREAAKSAGMSDFLTKPVRLKELLACLDRHVNT